MALGPQPSPFLLQTPRSMIPSLGSAWVLLMWGNFWSSLLWRAPTLFLADLPGLREGTAFPGGSDSKESACNAGDLGLIPRLGRSPGGGHGNPLQYSCPENPHRQRSLVGYSPWVSELDTTEQLSTAHEGTGLGQKGCCYKISPLQAYLALNKEKTSGFIKSQ